MKKIIITIMLFALSGISFATIIIVDINGAGQFTSIQLAIDNSLPGDTIQVWPGTYSGAININKNIVLQGSGYENTIITSSVNPTITMSIGVLKWFQISSTGGDGIKVAGGGKITNCVIKSCAGNGILCSNGYAYISNCILIQNGGWGFLVTMPGYAYVWSCISRNNTSGGYNGDGDPYYNCQYYLNISYSDGSVNCMSNGQGCIDVDPIFTSSTNYHLSTGSPCFNTGQPSLSDPDGSQSDMGYFGGPDCPIFPVVYEMTVTPNGSNINVQAKARANY
jgi:hypothetical protein